MQPRGINEIIASFSATMGEWLLILLALEFVTGIAVALKANEFDWSRTFDIVKKNAWIVVGWGAAAVISDAAGQMAYGLALAAVGGGVATNLASIFGVDVTGVLGQLVTKGPGNSSSAARAPKD